MRGKRAKALRKQSATVHGEDLNAAFPIRPGRRHGGPAIGAFPYPKRWRYEKRGEFDVLVASIEDIREEVEEKNG